jgi:hypothetical protein
MGGGEAANSVEKLKEAGLVGTEYMRRQKRAHGALLDESGPVSHFNPIQ